MTACLIGQPFIARRMASLVTLCLDREGESGYKQVRYGSKESEGITIFDHDRQLSLFRPTLPVTVPTSMNLEYVRREFIFGFAHKSTIALGHLIYLFVPAFPFPTLTLVNP
jgi:hypothetical protein